MEKTIVSKDLIMTDTSSMLMVESPSVLCVAFRYEFTVQLQDNKMPATMEYELCMKYELCSRHSNQCNNDNIQNSVAGRMRLVVCD